MGTPRYLYLADFLCNQHIKNTYRTSSIPNPKVHKEKKIKCQIHINDVPN